MSLPFPEIVKLIDEARFSELIGEPESNFLDAKSQPYQFESGNDAKREFAKDVSAFANSRGGFILVGLATERSSVRATEQISELRAIPQGIFDPDQHLKILSEWLYPIPKNVSVRWVPCGTDVGKGVGVIFIPNQDESLKPVLITKTLTDRKTTDITLG